MTYPPSHGYSLAASTAYDTAQEAVSFHTSTSVHTLGLKPAIRLAVVLRSAVFGLHDLAMTFQQYVQGRMTKQHRGSVPWDDEGYERRPNLPTRLSLPLRLVAHTRLNSS